MISKRIAKLHAFLRHVKRCGEIGRLFESPFQSFLRAYIARIA